MDSSAGCTCTTLVSSIVSLIALAARTSVPLSWAFVVSSNHLHPINCSLPCTPLPHRMSSESLFLAPMPSSRFLSYSLNYLFCGDGRLEFTPFFPSDSFFWCRYLLTVLHLPIDSCFTTGSISISTLVDPYT